MLAYAFQTLRERGYRSLGEEKFDNTAELCAAILTRGLAAQIRGGLVRGYVERKEELPCVRGRIDVSASLMRGGIMKRQLVCEYDEFTEDTYLNRIIKSTCLSLTHLDISDERRRELRRLLAYMSRIDTIELSSVDWRFPHDRCSHTSQMLAAVCRLVVNGLLPSPDGTRKKLADFDDENMSRLCANVSAAERYTLTIFIRYLRMSRTRRLCSTETCQVCCFTRRLTRMKHHAETAG